MAVVVQVGTLWLTSPPEVVHALIFDSPRSLSVWSVVVMWASFATALLASLRGPMRLALRRLCHVILAITIVVGSVVHALLINGTMAIVSKAVVCALFWAAATKVVADVPQLVDIAG